VLALQKVRKSDYRTIGFIESFYNKERNKIEKMATKRDRKNADNSAFSRFNEIYFLNYRKN